MASKLQYAERAKALASIMANLTDDLMGWRDVWWDRGYNDGGTDEMTDGDVAAQGVTTSQLVGLVTFADALETFLVANRAYVNKLRNDM